MIATLSNRKEKFLSSHRKKTGFVRAILGLNDKGDVVVEARIYHPGKYGDSPTYCAVWIRSDPEWHSGTGSANGGGYHKASAALAEAIDNAGIDLSEAIDGRGDFAMVEAVRAVTIAACGQCLNVLEAHA